MKKKNRGAAGQGPKGHSAKHSGKQDDRGGARTESRSGSGASGRAENRANNRADNRGGGRARNDSAAAKSGGRSGTQTGRRSSENAGDESASEQSAGGRKSGHRKPIRNARSLSEVLGMAKPGAASAPGPRGNFRPPRGGPAEKTAPADFRKRGGTSPNPALTGEFKPSSRPTAKAADPVKPKATKLQYIMNFIVPGSGDRAAEAKATKATANAAASAAKAKIVAETKVALEEKAQREARGEKIQPGRLGSDRGGRSTGRPTPNASRASGHSGNQSSHSSTNQKSTRGPKTESRSSGPARGQSRNQARNDSFHETQAEPRNEGRKTRSGTRRGHPEAAPRGRGRDHESPEKISGKPGSKQSDNAGNFDGGNARPSRGAKGSQASARKSVSKGSAQQLIEGFVKRHPDGYGFLIPDDRTIPDVYISRQWMNGVMTNDRVVAEIYANRGDKHGDKGERLFGEVKEVTAHANKRIVGKYLPVDLRYGVVLDEDHGWGADLRIQAADTMGAVEGDMIAVEISQYPGPDQEFLGKVIERIGNLDNPINDVKRVIYSKNIPEEFSTKALGEARKYGGEVTEGEIKGREDVRQLNLITIDGATARDFDDAVYVESSGNGFRLVVAIADVSHYVKPNTVLDEEAYERGTSTYFPNYVVPMLPEELSNELCSLKPHVTRLCFVCDMQISFDGEVTSSRFYEGVMESKARVTYGEAQEVLDGSTPGKFTHVRENIILAADLAKILMAKRMREGSLDLEIPETQVVVDKSGETIDIIKSERLFAHRLIEELMLVTNISTAKFFDANRVEGIYRIHEPPNDENIQTLQRYLWNFGGQATLGEGKLQKKLTRALESMHGKPGAQVLNILTLRSMNQAKYSSDNVGHFGLGFDHYSHFTSPIRRYPDLIAHRQIKSVLYPKYKYMQMTEEQLATSASFLSGCEQRSVKAERMLISIKKARFMKKYVGEEFDGVISSVAKFGIFVLLRQFDADGLVKSENLGNDRFVYDEENLKLVGKRTGLTYTIGDDIRIRVASADTEFGKIDFELASSPLKNPELGDEESETDEFGDLLPLNGATTGRGNEKKGSRRERTQKSEPKRASAGQPQTKLGRQSEQQAASESGKEGRDSKRSKNRGNAQKRGKAQDNSGGVRKERVSKSRRKD